MDAILTEFLARHSVRVEERIAWGDMPLCVSSYVTTELPPLQYVTSVRAVVLHGDAILVLHDGTKHLVLPGGRCEPGESVHETLSREVLEETGYMLDNAVLLGFMHFHHLAPEADGYAYPYPDFLQLVFTAEPGEYRPEQVVEDPLVKRSERMQVEDVIGLPLSLGERLYLMVALGQ